ncbi:hypothetical protein N865_03085 [Intrasporangium oryzae NRRL B-24470]|uniref:Glycosyltransferase subfamily 4-like N-terminal domain-containing protein n=1 Tax=Intrasporangium oryzae NRRL B-24470 TaxID=1386089 RepID=W9G9I1_9MICO|nr:glycosyltransferase family 4 protein [Intrasporangium oryzae]EWT02861.1 hypothetical protein N865_03085 [Intrasporangium oryzae NRRL B-24470]
MSNETPDLRGQGGQRRQYFQIRELVETGHDVTVATLDGPQSDESVRRLAEVVRLTSPGRRYLPDRRPDGMTRALFRRSFDRVVIAHTESWRTWRRELLRQDAPVLVDMHNVLSSWHGRQSRGREAHGWAKVEDEIMRRSAAVAVCSARELDELASGSRAQHERRAALVVLPHGVDPREWIAGPAPSAQPTIKLFGNWGWGPNRAGLEWFLREVWPRLSAIPGLRCDVAGAGTQATSVDPRLSFVGRVEDLSRFLSDAWVVGVPVREGVGAPVKYAEALVTGVPVVATGDGAPLRSDLATLVSDDPAEWTRCIAEVVARPEPARAAAAAVRRSALVDLSWHGVSRPLIDWVADPCPQPSGRFS